MFHKLQTRFLTLILTKCCYGEGDLWGAYFNLQHLNWLEEEGKQFLRTHMDIGDSYEAAVNCLHQWKDFHGDVNVSIFVVVVTTLLNTLFVFQLIGQQICATMVTGEELQEANHYASQQIENCTSDLSNQWENFCRLLQERVGLLEYSVNFHEKLQLVSKITWFTYLMFASFCHLTYCIVLNRSPGAYFLPSS